jgi:hypothetical protein
VGRGFAGFKFIQRANFLTVTPITSQQKCLWDDTSSVQKQQNRLIHPGGGFFMRCVWGEALCGLQFAANIFNDAVA